MRWVPVTVAPVKIAWDRLVLDIVAVLRFAFVKLTLTALVFVKLAPDRLAPVRLAPVRLALLKFAPERLVEERSTPVRAHPERFTPAPRREQSIVALAADPNSPSRSPVKSTGESRALIFVTDTQQDYQPTI